MHKLLVKNFLKDRTNMIGLFIFNAATLIVFFNMEQGTRKEVFYPLVLSCFSLVLLLITEWLKYYRFNFNMLKLEDNLNQELMPMTSEQKEMSRIKSLAFKKYIGELNGIMNHNKNRNYFMSQWIHNLKTPISVIDLITQNFKLEAKNPSDVIEDIKQENNRLHNSVEQLLSIIRLEEFEKDYKPEAIDLVQTIKRLLHNRKKQLIHIGIYPELKCEAEEMYILSDKKWNELMLDLVISNAIKYSRMDRKNKRIYINISKLEGNTIISIRDEGIGIPVYDIDRVFEPFFTGENGRKYRDSTGIGLYVCSEIARKLGHEIKIKSELMEGTELKFKYLTKL